MAFDREEFQKRREARQQQRQKKQRQTVVKLVIAALLLVLTTVLIVTLVHRQGHNTSAPSASTADTTAPPTTQIRLAAVGDLNITQRVVDAGGTEQDYTAAFLDVAHLLSDADITAVNFEGNLYGAPYGEDRSAPQALANHLRSIGVDLVQLANSYSIYKGMDGLSSTVTAIRSANMEPVGAYASQQEAEAAKGYTVRTVSGIKVAFVAFTKGMDGMALPGGNESCVNLLYTDYATTYQQVNTEGITAILDAVAKEKPDITVALLHWGSEYNDTVSESQQQICSLMQENGVDAIIGTHSHYVQQMVFDEAAGSFVAYSLGDFFGDAARSGSEYSVILELEITKNEDTGKTNISGYHYTPIFTVAEEGQPLRVVRIEQAIAAYEAGSLNRVSQQTYEAMQYALTRIEERIAGE